MSKDPMNPLIGSSLIGAGGGLLSSAFGAISSKIQFNRQKKLMQMQNEYNTPSAQKQRMLDAGLNPYGSAAQPVPAAAGSAPAAQAGLDLGGIASLVSSIVEAVKSPSDIEKTKADTAKSEQDVSALVFSSLLEWLKSLLDAILNFPNFQI